MVVGSFLQFVPLDVIFLYGKDEVYELRKHGRLSLWKRPLFQGNTLS